jgi:hypothetical protein
MGAATHRAPGPCRVARIPIRCHVLRNPPSVDLPARSRGLVPADHRDGSIRRGIRHWGVGCAYPPAAPVVAGSSWVLGAVGVLARSHTLRGISLGLAGYCSRGSDLAARSGPVDRRHRLVGAGRRHRRRARCVTRVRRRPNVGGVAGCRRRLQPGGSDMGTQCRRREFPSRRGPRINAMSPGSLR